MMRERFLLAFLTCVLIAVAALPHTEAHSGLSLSAYTATPPTIDGNIQASEWAAAATATFGPFGPGNAYTGTLYMMNDGTNLYIAVSISGDIDFDDDDILMFRFDNDHGGETSQEPGDDGLSAGIALPNGFNDAVYDIGGAWYTDDDHGGTVDGQAAGSRQGALNQWELSHPLDSTDDAHDFSLSLGQTVGFCLRLIIDGSYYDLSAYLLGCLLARGSVEIGTHVQYEITLRVPYREYQGIETHIVKLLQKNVGGLTLREIVSDPAITAESRRLGTPPQKLGRILSDLSTWSPPHKPWPVRMLERNSHLKWKIRTTELVAKFLESA